MKGYVLISVRAGEIREVVRQLLRTEGVVEANMTFGPYDAVAIIKADDVAHLGKIIAQGVQPIPGITHTLTCLAVEE
jgi:DNA-binding Lrp family transcriptional regulator